MTDPTKDKNRYCGECGREKTDHRPGCLSATLKGNLTGERQAIFDKGMNDVDSPAKLRYLADAFEKEELPEHAMRLRMRASDKERDRVTGKKYELATIKNARMVYDGDHQVHLVEVFLEFGAEQAMQSTHLSEEEAKSFADAVLATFDKKTLEELAGLKAYALRCWDSHHEPIEGLESVDTKRRFTKTRWLRQRHPAVVTQGPYEIKAAGVASEITRLRMQLEEKGEEMKRLEAGFTDWEFVP